MSDEIETLELRARIAPIIDEALAVITVAGERILWDSSYAMVPQGPGQVMCHGMIVLHAQNIAIIGGPAVTFSIITDLHDMLDPVAAASILRQGVGALREAQSQALRRPLGPINGSPEPGSGFIL